MQIALFAKAVFNLNAICKMKKCLFRSTRWRIVPLSNCVICENCTVCKRCFQFECNLQNGEMSFQIYSLEDRTLINLCNLCKLHNFKKLFSIWVQSAKWRNVFSDLHVGVPLSNCVICANCTICKTGLQFECHLKNEEIPRNHFM